MPLTTSPTQVKHNHNLIAVLWVLAGTAIFAVIFTSAKIVGSAELVWQIIFFRYLSGLCCMLLIAKHRQVEIAFSAKWPMHFVRALFGGLGGCAAIYAAANMAVADAAAIGLLDSVIAVLLGMLIFSERVSSYRWLAILGCVLGSAIVLTDKGAFQQAGFFGSAALVALIGAIFLALESVLIRALATSENVISILLHVNFFGFLMFAGPAIYTWELSAWTMKAVFCILGPMALLGQYCNIKGYQMAELSIVSPVGYSWILFAMLMDFIFFDQIIGYTTMLGASLILASGYLLAKTPDIARPVTAKTSL